MALADRAQALAKGATMVRQESRQDPRQDSRQDSRHDDAPAPHDKQDIENDIAKHELPAGTEAALKPAPEPAADKRPASADLLPAVDWDFG